MSHLSHLNQYTTIQLRVTEHVAAGVLERNVGTIGGIKKEKTQIQIDETESKGR